MTNLEKLRALLDSGEFHHATDRCHGTVWEGLWIYKRDPNGFRGYSLADVTFLRSSPDYEAALKMCSGTGISVGAYGHG